MHSQEVKQKVVDAYRITRGNITTTCACTDITRKTFKEWIATDADFAEQIQDIKESFLDKCEEVVRDSVYDEEDVQTAKWMLTNLARQRGFGDKVEHDFKNLPPPVINFILAPPAQSNTIDNSAEDLSCDPDRITTNENNELDSKSSG